ncbi:MAG: tRNA pseudouridine(55) synthase TruB [Planctomycetes bacterium]|nr:tRNA pseudouridine(55) synthase TruB [Planctomycetota bacterium]
MFGFLNIHKPPGPTSHDIVARLRRQLPRRTKVGHAGTLDPFAEGVLVVCVGQGTRLAEYVQHQPKRYRATVTLGATSSTDDATGEIIPRDVSQQPTREDILRATRALTGGIPQVPPAYSAVHVDGQRAYRRARRGETFDIPARSVEIHYIELVGYDWPQVVVNVWCGSGTYIRSLARDLGEALDVGGYCSALARLAVGAFCIEAAVLPHNVQPQQHLIPPLTMLGLPVVRLGVQASRLIAHGRALDVERLDMPQAGPRAEGRGTDLYAAVDAEGHLLAVATLVENGTALKPLKVFNPPAGPAGR